MSRFRLLKWLEETELIRLSDSIARLLRYTVIALLLLVILSQLLIQNDRIRSFITSADRWEGTRLN